ncbi:MAG: hypothetical protein WD271_06615 [Acidimicrobiia bacterium]
MAVWVVVGVIGVGAIAAALASRRHAAEIEPTVREFAEFRDALSQQVAGVRADTRTTGRHTDRPHDARLDDSDATT